MIKKARFCTFSSDSVCSAVKLLCQTGAAYSRTVDSQENNYKTAELSQRRPRDAPNIWVHWKVLRVLTTHLATFPEICNGLLFRSTLRMCVQNLKFVALPVPEIIGGTQKNWAVLDTPTLPFLQNFSWAFVRMDPLNISPKFDVRSFIHSWDNRGYFKNLGSPWIRPRSRPMLPNF